MLLFFIDFSPVFDQTASTFMHLLIFSGTITRRCFLNRSWEPIKYDKHCKELPADIRRTRLDTFYVAHNLSTEKVWFYKKTLFILVNVSVGFNKLPKRLLLFRELSFQNSPSPNLLHLYDIYYYDIYITKILQRSSLTKRCDNLLQIIFSHVRVLSTIYESAPSSRFKNPLTTAKKYV